MISKKKLISELKNKTLLLSTLFTFTFTTNLQAQEGCCIQEDPTSKQNLIVGSIAIALVGAGIAVALSGHARNNLSNCSSYLYSYSGGLTDWSSSSSSSHSSHHSHSHSSNSHHSGNHSSHHSSSGNHSSHSGSYSNHGSKHSRITNAFTIPNDLSSNLKITFTNETNIEATAIVTSPNGHTNEKQLIGEKDEAIFNYCFDEILPGTFTLDLVVPAELSSGALLGNIEVTDQLGNMIEHYTLLAP